MNARPLPNAPAQTTADLTALNQAAKWFAVLQFGASQEDYDQWQRWLNSDARHQSAWEEVQAIFPPFEQVADIAHKQAARNALMQPARMSRRSALKLLGFGGTALLAGVLVKRYSPWRDWVTTLASHSESLHVAVGQTGMTPLADGSKLWLNTASQARVEYSMALRRITLLAGELLIDSAKDNTTPARPLVVDTQHGRLTALGTRFTVKLAQNHTFLAVYQGAVSISSSNGWGNPSDNNAHVRVIEAGNQTVFTADSIANPMPADKARESWTRGMLLADNRRLDDFVAELATYRHGKLSVAPNVAHLSLMGAFPLHDTNRVLLAITEVLPVRIHHISALEIQLVARN